MFSSISTSSRNQSYSKRNSATPNKLAKQRPTLDVSGTFDSGSAPALSLSPVNMANNGGNTTLSGPAPDNLHAVNEPLTSANTALPILPSIRSFRSRFTFGSKSGSAKKEKLVDEAGNSSTASIVQISPAEQDDDKVEIAAANQTLDPSALRSSSSLNMPPTDDLLLPRMQSQPSLRFDPPISSRKRKSFDFAGLSRSGSAGPSRPSFASVRSFGSRAFTPNGTAIREVVSEGEGDEEDDGVIVNLRPKTGPAAEFGDEAPPRVSFASQRTITTTRSHNRRRSRSTDSPRVSTDTANITRVIDLSAEILSSPKVNSLESSRAEMGHEQEDSGKDWDLNDLKGAVSRMKTLVNVAGMSGDDSPANSPILPSPSSPNPIHSVLNTPILPSSLGTLTPTASRLSYTNATPISRSPAHLQTPILGVPNAKPPRSPLSPSTAIPEVTVQSPSTINDVCETSFTSMNIDVNAVERVLEARGVGSQWVRDIFSGEGEESRIEEPSWEEEPSLSSDKQDVTGEPQGEGISESSSRGSLDLGSLDPNLAMLLSPNNLLALTTTSTPAKPSPRQTTRQHASDDTTTTLTLKWAADVRGRERSGSAAAALISTIPSPTTQNSGELLRSDSHSKSRSNSMTPTPVLTPILLTPSKAYSKLGTGPPSASSASPVEPPSKRSSIDPPPRRSSETTTTSASSVFASTTSEASSSAGTRVTSSSGFHQSSNSLRKSIPPPLPLMIPAPLPPKQISPETPCFPSPARRRVGSSPSTPAGSSGRRRTRTISTDHPYAEDDMPSSPERPRRTPIGRAKSAMDVEMPRSGGGGGTGRNGGGDAKKKHVRRESSFEAGARRPSRDQTTNQGLEEESMPLFPRPATSAAHHRRFRLNSPERSSGSRYEERERDRENHSPTREQQFPPRAMTSFSFNNNNTSHSGITAGTVRPAASGRPSFDRGPPPISGSGNMTVRKRRSYSIDASAGMRFGNAIAGGSLRQHSSPNAANGGVGGNESRLDPMGPLTKRAFAAAGLIASPGAAAAANQDNSNGRATSASPFPASRSHGVNVTNGWKDATGTPPMGRPPGMPRASTVADMRRGERESGFGGTTTPSNAGSGSGGYAQNDHPSTPSSASGGTGGTTGSRTLYAGSTASSSGGGTNTNTHRTGSAGSPSPIDPPPSSSESSVVAALKERHELEKDALVSALAEAKRVNKELSKEKSELVAYVGTLESRLEEALEMNRRMEGVRNAVLAMTGGAGFPPMMGGAGVGVGGFSPHAAAPVEEKKARRRGPGAMELLAARRRGAFDESGRKSSKTAIRRPRTADALADDDDRFSEEQGHYLDAGDEERDRGTLPYGSSTYGSSRRDFTTIAGGPIPRTKTLTTRRSASEASVILPAMKASREMSMLIHELPPHHETHYAASSVADDHEYDEYDYSDHTHLPQDRDIGSPTAAPSFSFMERDERDAESDDDDGGSLKLRLSDEIHLAELVSMGPGSADERGDLESRRGDEDGYDSNECF